MKVKCLEGWNQRQALGMADVWPHPPLSSQGILVATVWCVAGNGEHKSSGCRSAQSSFSPSHFLPSQMEQRVLQSPDSLTASRWWPPGLQILPSRSCRAS